MAIQPVDLQTLFMRLNQVGKEQATQQHAAVAGQDAAADRITEESLRDERAVNQAQEVSDGPEQVSDDQKKEGDRRSPRRDRSGDEEDDESRPRPVFRDPDLGKRVDLSG